MKIKEITNLFIEEYQDKFKSWIENPESDIHNLLTDSRNIFDPIETLFFAIKTENGNDGHYFIDELYDKGVRNFVISETKEKFNKYKDANFLMVPDVISALGVIGSQHQKNAKEIVAITGSRGKTTVKEIIFQLLEPYRKISRSPRSYNSKIGVPLSLWQISPESDIALIEAGISQSGEMKAHSHLIEPSIVILTNIGDAHSSGFLSLEEKAKEKVSLALGPWVKKIVYPYDSELIRKNVETFKDTKELIGWSVKNPKAELFIKPIEGGLECKWKNKIFKIPFHQEKEYDLENISVAISFLLSENIEENVIAERIGRLHKINTRLKVSEGMDGCSVILDSYTSDLSSLPPAIDFMKRRKMPDQNMALIMSDLHHEGQSPDITYKHLSNIIRISGIKKFIGIGSTLEKYKELFPSGSKFYESTISFLNDFSLSNFSNEIILLKGSKEFNFSKIHELLEARKHETVLEVNLDALLRNYNYFRGLVPHGTGMICMVKAFGYGVGSYEIAKTLQDAGAAYLAVAAIDEGIDLRQNGISMPIMIMNPRSANYRALFNFRLEPAIYSMSLLSSMIDDSEKNGIGEYPVHIKLDTGMHRMGFLEEDIEDLIQLLKNTKGLKVATIFSHLATADCLDMDEFTIRQLEKFENISSKIIKGLGYPIKRHILNSAGIIRFPEYHYELVRLGIGLYGANTLPYSIEKPLSTVASLRSVIICIREIGGDEAVGYGRNGKINGKTKIATLPVGYADGINRKFGNGALKVFLNGKLAPTIGNICMDATMIDVSNIECKEGDTVEIFGENMNIQILADKLETIPYEILTSVSPRVKRVYYRE